MFSKLFKASVPAQQWYILSAARASASLPAATKRFNSSISASSGGGGGGGGGAGACRPSPNKVVFISQSTDIFSNLAFEAWLYKNWTFGHRQLLLLWRNSPCVVIGRHQNAFKEANLSYLESAHVPLARRYSGGGAVYHDVGNLNCTFFSPRESYNRHWNLELLCKALRSDFNLNVKLNSRDDILFNETLKVSGSAAKLGRVTAYHHCTLLVNTDHAQLSLALRGDKSLETAATASVPSSVGNLSTGAAGDGSSGAGLSVERVLGSIADHYLEAALPGHELQHDPHATKQRSHGITLVNPQDDWFPGLGEIREELVSWDWVYGKTPRFTKTMQVTVPPRNSHDGPKSVAVKVLCQRGLVEELRVVDSASAGEGLSVLIQGEVSDAVRGTPYTPQLEALVAAMLKLSHPGHQNNNSTDTLNL